MSEILIDELVSRPYEEYSFSTASTVFFNVQFPLTGSLDISMEDLVPFDIGYQLTEKKRITGIPKG